MNPFIVGLIPLLLVVAVAPISDNLLLALRTSIKEKRFVRPWSNYNRNYSNPIIAAQMVATLVMTIIIPLLGFTGLVNGLIQNGSVMLVIFTILFLAWVNKIYYCKSNVWRALLCSVFGLIALAVQVGSAQMSTVVNASAGNFNLAVIVAIVSLFFSTVLLFKPLDVLESALKDVVVVQRVIWALFLSNLIWPYFGNSDMGVAQLVSSVLVISFIKILAATIVFDGIWLNKFLVKQLTVKRLVGLSVLCIVVSLSISIYNLAV